MLIAVLILLVLLAVPAAAQIPQEVACQNAGAKCVCARSLRTAGNWVQGAGGDQNAWHESDQNSNDPKMCGYINFNGSGKNVIDYQGLPGPTAVAGPNNLTGVMQLNFGSGTFNLPFRPNFAPQNRMGTRHYFMNSSNYESYGTSCVQDKVWQIGDYFTTMGGAPGTYFQWHGANGVDNPNGPVTLVPTGGIDSTTVRNKLIRFEVYINVTGTYPYTRNIQSLDVYWKNVTDNIEYSRNIVVGSFEQQFVGGRCGSGVGEWAMCTENLQNWDKMIHRFRRDNCAGTTKYMYAIMMQNLGPTERIPPAVEVEGGGPPPVKPNPPTNLRITSRLMSAWVALTRTGWGW